jgi:hypothetical protein
MKYSNKELQHGWILISLIFSSQDSFPDVINTGHALSPNNDKR